MRSYLNNLSVGLMVKAEVVELQSLTEVIVSFNGDLLKVQNKTRRSFKLGDCVDLIITSLKPFGFKLATRGSQKHLKLDISV